MELTFLCGDIPIKMYIFPIKIYVIRIRYMCSRWNKWRKMKQEREDREEARGVLNFLKGDR